MLRQLHIIILFAVTILLLSGCSDFFDEGNIQRVGMLVENSVHDEPWAQKGYKGLQAISEEFEVDVFFKENIQTEQDLREAVEDLSNRGVNLIFGHSSTYGKFFEDISASYPSIHFVYFNGGYFGEDLTSLNFNSHAMGFFGGMVAGKMTESNQVGIIGAYEWQPEIEGFFEGVKYQNPDAEVHFNYVHSWNDKKKALKQYKEMREKGVDVFYPTGDIYSEAIIKQAAEDGVYAIGYVTDQADIDKKTVLTSTVQHVEDLYVLIAEQFNEGELRGGVMTFDFQDEVISLGKFSPDVPEDFREKVMDEVEAYKDTGLLPNERQ
ncbi:BMP family ABC transporter substrate-binding protein [Virgibacillus kekensis]|uniref:BMP family ABC transporter substrate-binding protein n=1 Tax=Virgibacillus kekensis TaxID=202261 RepID=A0ABV9DMV3_9BACI